MSVVLYFQVETSPAARRRSQRWWHFARFSMPEDPLMYALLAGLRADEWPDGKLEFIPPKGLPDDVAEQTLAENCLTIDDEAAALELPDTCSREAAEEWVASGLSRFLHNGYAVTHPDFHSQSWLSLDELLSVLQRYETAEGLGIRELQAVVAMMRSLQDGGLASRAVFWFN